MRASVITDEISQDFEHALDVMLEYGVKAAELRGLWGTNIADLTADQVTRAKNALAERGMVVSCLSTPFFKCDLDSAEAAERGMMHLATARGMGEQMDLLRRCAGLAHEFGTPLIRAFTFWRRGELTPAIEDQIVAAFTEPIRIADGEGVILALENEHACFIGTGAEAGRVLSRLDSPTVRACWDPGNAFFAGETPYPGGYDAISPYLVHVHIKDAVTVAGQAGAPEATGAAHPDSLKWAVVGEGDIDYDGQFAALRAADYQGFISLETHYVPENGTQEDGSRACLVGLRRFLKD